MGRKAKRLSASKKTIEEVIALRRRTGIIDERPKSTSVERLMESPVRRLESAPELQSRSSGATNLSQLAQQCESLAKKMREIEQRYDQIQHPSISQEYCDLVAQVVQETHETPTINKKVREKIAQNLRLSINELGNTVSKLDHVFLDLSTLEDRRSAAATEISRCIRGYLTRRSYKECISGLRQWRQKHATRLMDALTRFITHQQQIDHGILSLDHRRKMKQKSIIVAEWKNITAINLPGVVKRRKMADLKFEATRKRLLLHIMKNWFAMAIGPRSCRQLQLNYHKRLLKARETLESLERYVVITNDMAREEVTKQVVREIRRRHQYHVLNMYWQALYNDVYLVRMKKYQIARNHIRQKRRRKAFNGWCGHVILRKAQMKPDSGDLIRRQPGWEKFQGRFNLQMIDHFHQSNMLRAHFKALVDHVERYREVRIRFEKVTQRTMLHVLRSLQIQAKYQAQLRAVALSEWKNFCNRLYYVPFRAWFLYSSERRARHRIQRYLIRAFTRKRQRQHACTIFHTWSHQAKYGQIQGMHSKVELIKTLEKQKTFTLALEDTCSMYKTAIAELETRIQTEQDLAQEKQQQYETLLKKGQDDRFALHHAEQQLSILQSMLDAAGHLHPITVARIRNHMKKETKHGFDQDLVKLAQVQNELLGADARKMVKHVNKLNGHGDGDSSSDEEKRSKRSENESLLLKRVKWVLSRMEVLDEGNQGVSEPLSPQAAHVYAFLEFIRSGDAGHLIPEDRPDDSDVKSQSKVIPIQLINKGKTWEDFVRVTATKFPPRRRVPIRVRSYRDRIGFYS